MVGGAGRVWRHAKNGTETGATGESIGTVVHEVRHRPWLDGVGGRCTFSPDGRFFWAVRPGGEERVVSVEVLECDGWRTVATEEFEAEEDGFWAIRCEKRAHIRAMRVTGSPLRNRRASHGQGKRS
jgi:hypothetical protein